MTKVADGSAIFIGSENMVKRAEDFMLAFSSQQSSLTQPETVI